MITGYDVTHLSPKVADLIDWEVLATACEKEYPSWLGWVTRDVTGVCGVGKALERWKSQNHSRYTRCDTAKEDHRHVYQHLAHCTKWNGMEQ